MYFAFTYIKCVYIIHEKLLTTDHLWDNFESREYIIYEKYFQLKKVLDMSGSYYRKWMEGNTSKTTKDSNFFEICK